MNLHIMAEMLELKFLCLSTVFTAIQFTENGNAELVLKHNSSEAVIGDRVIFTCSTSLNASEIHWFHYPISTNPLRELVYGFGKMSPHYSRFLFERNNSTNTLSLIIPHVHLDDAGKYVCQDDYGRGDKDFAELIVLDSSPVCRSATDINKVIGENNCGIEPDKLILSCVVQYNGNEVPQMQWRKFGREETSVILSTSANQKNKAIFNISVSGDSIQNYSSFECSAVRGVSTKSRCQSGNATVISRTVYCEHCTSDHQQNVGMVFGITFVVIILVSVLIAVGVTYYCRIHKQRCKVEKKQPEKKIMSEEVTEREELLQDDMSKEKTVTASTEAKAESDCVLLSKNKELEDLKKINENLEAKNKKNDREFQQKDETIKKLGEEKVETVKEFEHYLYLKETIFYSDKMTHDSSIITKASQDNKKPIIGLAVLGKLLYILHEKETLIDVYDSFSCIFQRQCPIPIIEEPMDIAPFTEHSQTGLFVIGRIPLLNHISSTADNTAYPNDNPDITPSPTAFIGLNVNDDTSSSHILRINTSGEEQNIWPSGGDLGRLAVHTSNVIVCFVEILLIKEYKFNGELIHTISLSPADGFKYLWHALKVTSNHFVVSHGINEDESHSVCVVDLEGKTVKDCFEWGKSKMLPCKPTTFQVPCYLLEDDEKSILVADRDNNRIILLNLSMNYRMKLADLQSGHFIARMSFDKTGSRLFVAVNERKNSIPGWKRGQVLVFKVK